MTYVPHCPGSEHSVCINGVLYYKATPNMSSSSDDIMITCFDVRSEKFMSFIKVTETFSGKATLINYKGTLASLAPKGS